MTIKIWGRNRISRRRLRTVESRKDKSVLAGIDPKLKTVAYNRLAILRAWHRKLSEPRRPKAKTEVMRSFLADLNSGILWPDGASMPIRHIARSTLYYWDQIYRNGGLLALVPRYKTKLSTERATFLPLAKPIEMKFPGPPRRSGKVNFLHRVKRRWKNPPLDCPIHLTIFYSMPIPKGTKMRRRMKMLKRQISHTIKPNLDTLNAFIVDCLSGIVFRDYSQIVQFHSKKEYGWWPQTRILIKALSK
jgi:Holliday junction resolvase RusA-like endonuclease